MTIGNHIKTKLSKFSFILSDDEISDYLIAHDLTSSEEYSKDLSIPVMKVLTDIIPELLLLPEVKQGDFSIKHNVEGIKSYYSLLCQKAGVEDKINPSNYEVCDRSELW